MVRATHYPKRWLPAGLIAAVALVALAVGVVAWALTRSDSTDTGATLARSLAAARSDPAVARQLPVQAMEIDSAAPAATLQEAATKATLIMHGRVTAVEFRAGNAGVSTLVTLRVGGVVKGERTLASSTITVVQPGGPVNYPDEHGVVTTQLLQSPADPILFPGTEVVLFLTADSDEQGAFWSAWPTTSQYRVVDGAVQALAGNPFASDVDGVSPDAFMDATRNAAASP